MKTLLYLLWDFIAVNNILIIEVLLLDVEWLLDVGIE